MTTPTITCEQFGDLLADFLERDVDETTRARMESHALVCHDCHDCGSLLADLRRLRIDAAALPSLAPSRDLWSGIAARIETPVVELTSSGRIDGAPAEFRMPQRTPRRVAPIWMGLAAAGLVAITAGVTYQLTKQSDAGRETSVMRVAQAPVEVADSSNTATPAVTPRTTGVRATTGQEATALPTARAATPPATASLASNKLSPEQTYDREIARLRAIVTQRRSTLDTATIGVIERNLGIIDDAIGQCRAALLKDPASRFLLESLNDALDTKIQLLRTAAMLPARS